MTFRFSARGGNSSNRDDRDLGPELLTAVEARRIHDELHWDISCQLLGEVKALRQDLEAHDAHMKMFAWENYRRGGESLADAKKRFYRSLPKATGGMRLLQLGNAKLLGEFDALCKEHGLTYWIDFGTLLGAFRHDGFIPWDDDVDLGMMRSDVDALMAIVASDSRYSVTVAYDRFVYCRQVRFRYADESLPCFADIFIYDWCEKVDSQKAECQRSLRCKMIDRINNDRALSFWEEEPYYDGPRSAELEACFERCRMESEEEGIICDNDDAGAVIWSVDNLDDGNQGQWSYSISDLFPTKRMTFEGVELEAPANPDVFLRSRYGDVMELPKDINTHFEHVDHDGLETSETAASLRDLLSED